MVCCMECHNKMKSQKTTMSFKNDRIVLNGIREYYCTNCENRIITAQEYDKVFKAYQKLQDDLKAPAKLSQVIAML